MRNIILAIAAMALLAACASKEQKALMQTYEKNKPYHKHLQKTEKIQLYDGEVTKVLLTATYLYEQAPDKNDIRDELFVVGVHIEGSEESSFERGDYSLTLNGYAPKSIKLLEEGSPLLKDLSFVTEWGHYYRIIFPHVSSKSFILVFKSDVYGKGVLKFAKVAKYTLPKKGI